MAAWPIARAIAGRPTKRPARPPRRWPTGLPRTVRRRALQAHGDRQRSGSARTLDIDTRAGSRRRSTCPRGCSSAGKQRINFQLTGRGQYTFQAILSGFVAADKLKSTTQGLDRPRSLRAGAAGIRRPGNSPRLRHLARQLIRRSAIRSRNCRSAAAGTSSWKSGGQHPGRSRRRSRSSYLVVTEPLPCGTTVIESSIAGGFERYEIDPGEITFYIGSRPYVDPIRSTCMAICRANTAPRRRCAQRLSARSNGGRRAARS